MTTVNIHDAKTHFSKLVAKVEAGEDVIIARDGTPVARLTAIRPRRTARIPGRDRGRFTVPHDFDAPLPESVLDEFAS
jgi:prevent-host-death family protein